MDLLVYNEYKQTIETRADIQLVLTCFITYHADADEEKQKGDVLFKDSSQTHMDHVSSKMALQTYVKTQIHKPTKPLPILTEVIINYQVNDVEVKPLVATTYKQTICDFFLSKQIQIGRFTFAIERIDAVTKNWLYLSLSKL